MSINFSRVIANNNSENVILESKIEVKNANLYYGSFKALEDMSMNIYKNRVTALIGPSGCGKSSFIKILNRMIELIPGSRLEGSVTLDGDNIYGKNVDPVDIRLRVGQIFQKPNPFPSSIYENVAYGLRIQGINNKKTLDEVVEKSLVDAALFKEIKDKLQQSALALSGGQQQRLCIARALAVQPEVLLMDEPCSALDPISTQRIEDLIAKLKENLTVVIVTHNMQQAARVSDFTAFLLSEFASTPGKLIEFGLTGKLLTQPSNKKTEDFITGRFG